MFNKELLMSYFHGKDLEIIESLIYQPELEPAFDVMRGALVWIDERPDGLSSKGYEKLIDLWIVRSCIHRGISLSDGTLDPEYFEKAWSEARAQKFSWPGFNRLKLSEEDRIYYMKELENAEEEI
jgi:hypothetical protein